MQQAVMYLLCPNNPILNRLMIALEGFVLFVHLSPNIESLC